MAYTGPAEVEVARDFQPQVILCNLGVPGFEEVIAAVSGYDNVDERHKSRETDIDRHLIRPIGRAALEKLINYHVTR